MSSRRLVLGALLAGCGDTTASPPSTSSTGRLESSSSDGSTTAGAGTTAVDTGSSGDAASSSTGEVLDGPGCGAPPPCNGTVFEGSVRLESAADLAMIEGVSIVTGFVEVLGTDLECLDMLGCLEEVGRDLRIQDNAALRSTAGLANVSTVGARVDGNGSVIIARNPALESLEGFALERVDGVVAVWGHDALREIPGFDGLRRLNTLTVNDNPALESLEGLRSLNRLARCDVNRNPVLCLSEVFAVCGDVVESPGGVTDFNDDAC